GIHVLTTAQRDKAWMAGTSPAMTSKLKRRKRQFTRAFERYLEGDFAVMRAGKLERRDLERPLDRAEVRNHDLAVAHRAVEEGLAHECVRLRVLEQPRAGDGGALHARAFQEFAPASGAFRVRDIHGLRVESERLSAQ